MNKKPEKEEHMSQARPSAKEIKEAANRANFSLTDDEVAKLERGETVSVQQTKVQTVRGCSGIKIVDLGGGCGLYLNPFPPSISVCCET